MVLAARFTSWPNGSIDWVVTGFCASACCGQAKPIIAAAIASNGARWRDDITGSLDGSAQTSNLGVEAAQGDANNIAWRQDEPCPKCMQSSWYAVPGSQGASGQSGGFDPISASEMSPLANHAFVKMNGLGNEIVVVDLRAAPDAGAPSAAGAITAADARAAAQPAGGAPYDQLMVLQPARAPGTDGFVRIYNNDGSEAGACGNGMRCVAELIFRETGKTTLTF